MFSSQNSQVSSAANYIEDVFSTYLYAGNGSTQTITNGIDLSGKGGLVWQKSRTSGFAYTSHILHSPNVTSGTNQLLLDSATTAGAGVTSGAYTYLSTGFSINGGFNDFGNASGQNYASWTFRKQPKFFDVVTYTGTGSAGQFVPHNLQSSYGFAVIKRTDSTSDWWVLAKESSADSYWQIKLNSTDAYTNLLSADPNTSTGFYPSSFNAGAYSNGATYVAYLFAATSSGGFGLLGTDSVVSCGTYIGTGTAGLTVTLGYEPQWVMIKRVFGVGNWTMFDNMRGMPVGSADAYLYANSSAAEASFELISPTATGFKIESTVAGINTADDYYIYIAIRRGPMKVPTSGTSVFTPTAANNSLDTKNTTSFPIDLQLGKYREIDSNILSTDRLRGISTTSTSSGQQLRTNTTNAEDSGSWTRGWDNTGFLTPVAYADTPTILWNFQRAPSFFDEVCYTGNGSSQYINHNLGVFPQLVIAKARSSVANWAVRYCSDATYAEDMFLGLNSTSANPFTSIGGQVLGISATQILATDAFGSLASSNANGVTYVAYLFATCAGVSKVGSYTGTGATQTIACGFTGGARFVLIKRTDNTGNWFVWDTARGMVAGTDPRLAINSTAAESNANWIYTATGGFQIVTTDASVNASGGNYIYLAIA